MLDYKKSDPSRSTRKPQSEGDYIAFAKKNLGRVELRLGGHFVSPKERHLRCRMWDMEKENLVYLISPVRQVTTEQAETIAGYAESLKRNGVRLFNPVVDAPQQDETGYNIVMAEREFMYQAACHGGRVDILWNAGGTPSEGSRVDLGMAIALGFEFNLVGVFNEDLPTGTQLGLQIIKEISDRNISRSPLLREIFTTLDDLTWSNKITIDWDMEMLTSEQEWQRIYLGLALGCIAQNPNINIKMGKLAGEDPINKKSYVKVIKEIEKRQRVE